MRSIIIIAVIALSGLLFAQQPALTALGPSGGMITHVTGSFLDDVTFAVVKENGLYRSTDGGESWRFVTTPNNIFQNLTIGQISIHPYNSNVVLIATSKGLYTSTDKGSTWNAPAAFPSPTHSVKFVPANPAIIYGSDDAGVLRSTDGGKNWNPLKDNIYFGNRPVYNIAIHPSDAGNIRMIVTTSFNDTTAMFFSPNGGFSWRPFNRNLPYGAARRVYALEIDSTGIDKAHFQAIIGTAAGVFGMQTDQADSSWQILKVNNQPFSGVVTCGTVVYDRFDPAVGANGEHKFSFLIASNASEFDGIPAQSSIQHGLFRIDSRLGSVFPINPLIQPPVTKVFNGLTDITSIFSPFLKNKGKLYLGTAAGIFVSADTGITWQKKNIGINASLVGNLVTLQQTSASKQVFGGIYGGGIIRSSDEGATWSSANIGLGSPYVTSMAADKKRNIVYAGTSYSLYRSTNLGASWNVAFNIDSTVVINKQYFRTGNNDMTVRVSDRNPDFILIHTKAYGLRLSTNAGASWSMVNPPVYADTLHVPEHFEFDPTDSLAIYFAGYGLHRSADLGKTWVNISGNLPKSMASTAASGSLPILTLSPTINPKNNKEILLPSIFDEQSGIPYRVFKTTNGGTLWDTLSIRAYDALFDQFDERKILATGPFGVFGSEDGGNNWKKFSDSVQNVRFMLVNGHAVNSNIAYIGSESGAYKLEFTGLPMLTIDTAFYDFGSVQAGKDSLRYITLSNKNGLSKAVVKFQALSDSIAFRYPGPRLIEILPGEESLIPVRFVSQESGSHGALLTFQTNDPRVPVLLVILTGNTVTRNVFEKFVIDVGSVTVGKDSVLSIPIDNKEGQRSISLTFLKQTGDTAAFEYLSASTVKVDSGKLGVITVRCAPKTTGEKTVYYLFSTNDVRFPFIQYRLKEFGVAKNFITRRVFIDTSVGFVSMNGTGIADYFKLLTLSLKRSDIVVHYQKLLPFSAYNALMYVQPNGPPQSDLIDSLQRYVGNGGTIVVAGDSGPDRNPYLNTFLNDSGWARKYSARTGLKLNSDLLVDSLYFATGLEGAVTAKPVSGHIYMKNVDSVIAYMPGSISVDTSVHNAEPLLKTISPSLFSVNALDTAAGKKKDAVIAALTKIGKGRIVLLSDVDLWWNGVPDDTTKPFGVFGGKNLQLALNIFGLIDDLVALLEPTPQEAYDMISIPYAFSDSTVDVLFKDLGKPNKMLWRMFGKYTSTKGYAEYPDDFRTIQRGEAYWLIAKNPVNMNMGTTTMQGTEEDFAVTLHPGYNMVGNPFPYSVSWTNSMVPDSVERVLWSYQNGKYDSTTTVMKPFRGYWIKNRGKFPKTVRISSLQVTGTGNIPKQQNDSRILETDEWKIQLTARSAVASDEQNYVGVVRGASDGIDDLDFSKPPVSPSGYISLSMRNPEGKLAADYRSASADGHVWDLDLVSSQSNTSVSITLGQFGAIDHSFRIYLLDNKLERVYDMTGQSEYSLILGKTENNRSFRLIVGGEGFAQHHLNGVPLVPVEYSLSQNFPNPFNPSTTIQYSLSHSGITTVDIFNILGQKIKTLVNEFQPIGHYSVQWDGRDAAQSPVSSGVYYYRVHCNDFASVKKMTLIK
ncbi:MAG: VPS10 domain-containing protein [Bacteroidota bacterium]